MRFWGRSLICAVSLAAGACCLLAGCATWLRTSTSTLPAPASVSYEQLQIYSNFTIAKHHRLMEELLAQRKDVAARLDLPLSDEPIHVFLFQAADEYNEYVGKHFPNFPRRRAMFVETDTRLAVYAHWGDRVAEDLRHEVAHGYLHATVSHIPLWLDEGLAEFFEVPRGRAGLNHPHVELLLQSRAKGIWQPDMERLAALKSPGDMTQLDYAESWLWTHYLLETSRERLLLLQTHMAVLRREGTAVPLWESLKRLEPDPQAAVVKYLDELAKSLQLAADGAPLRRESSR